jgi:hypothetical protein
MNLVTECFLISQVVFERDGRRIATAKVWRDRGAMFEGGEVQVRSAILEQLEAGRQFRTLARDEKGDWKKGGVVQVRILNGVPYLGTDDADGEYDSFSELRAQGRGGGTWDARRSLVPKRAERP